MVNRYFGKNYCVSLRPTKIPIIAPMPLKISEEKERKSAPQRSGIKLPATEPTERKT